MGRIEPTLTVPEAAKVLGVNVRRVYSLLKKGLLRRASSAFQRNVTLYAEEVHAYKDAGASTAQTLRQTQSELLSEKAFRITLERRLERCERLLGIHPTVVRYEVTEVLDLVERVHEALKNPPTEVMDILGWCAVFFDVHEELFDLIETHTGNPDPWAPLLTLAEKMYKRRSDSLDHEDQAAHTELAAARRSLRQAAFFYLLRRRGIDHARKTIVEADTDIIRKLNRRVKRLATPGT